MTNSPGSEASHDSGDENNDNNQSSKTPAVKDKECQYCHQKFTSSSLGRHLDQFISKKKPDGIHDVDEIRRMRGGITRRTARHNHKKEQDETNSNQHSPSPQYTLPSYSELLNKTTAPSGEMRFNRMNWQATGVITDPSSLNPPAVSTASQSVSNAPASVSAGTKRNFSTYAADLPTLNPVISETTRALELSLREVLDAVRTATQRALPTQLPFTFDFTAQTFPSLCLALLPVPATLFTSTPFATSTSLPLSPPGVDQYQTLHKTIEYKIDSWKWARVAHIQRTSSAPNFSEEVELVNETAASQLSTALQHLEAAYHSFMSFTPETKQNLWTVELLRSVKSEQEKVKEAKAAVERLTQEANQLQQQIDHLSRCQWPREMALWPPDRMTLDEKTRDELSRINLVRGESNGSQDPGSDNFSDDNQRGTIDRWDYEILLNKWKKHVREDRSRRTGMAPTMPFLPGTSQSAPAENHVSVPSDHSTASTPRLPSGLSKATMADHRSGSIGHSVDATSLHNSPLVNGISSGGTGGLPGIDSRRRNFPVVSDVDDIFTPRLKGLRADGLMKSATP